MQRRIETRLDPDIEAQGFDKMRSRITITLTDGSEIAGWADERYRGGPENPLTDGEVEDKFRSCCDGVLDAGEQQALLARLWSVLDSDDAGALAGLLNGKAGA